MYVHNVVGTGRYTTSTTNMYNKDFTYVMDPICFKKISGINFSSAVDKVDAYLESELYQSIGL